jgi:hypothetical protein
MERFIAWSNIARFEEMLSRETDPEERRIVETLLREERLKLRAAEGKWRQAATTADHTQAAC